MSDFLDAKSIDHVNMKVKNLEQSVEFYKNLFGFFANSERSHPPSLYSDMNFVFSDY